MGLSTRLKNGVAAEQANKEACRRAERAGERADRRTRQCRRHCRKRVRGLLDDEFENAARVIDRCTGHVLDAAPHGIAVLGLLVFDLLAELRQRSGVILLDGLGILCGFDNSVGTSSICASGGLEGASRLLRARRERFPQSREEAFRLCGRCSVVPREPRGKRRDGLGCRWGRRTLLVIPSETGRQRGNGVSSRRFCDKKWRVKRHAWYRRRLLPFGERVGARATAAKPLDLRVPHIHEVAAGDVVHIAKLATHVGRHVAPDRLLCPIRPLLLAFGSGIHILPCRRIRVTPVLIRATNTLLVDHIQFSRRRFSPVASREVLTFGLEFDRRGFRVFDRVVNVPGPAIAREFLVGKLEQTLVTSRPCARVATRLDGCKRSQQVSIYTVGLRHVVEDAVNLGRETCRARSSHGWQASTCNRRSRGRWLRDGIGNERDLGNSGRTEVGLVPREPRRQRREPKRVIGRHLWYPDLVLIW